MKEQIAQPASRLLKLFLGGILIAVGMVFLLRQMGVPMPGWLISWPMLLVLTGLWMGLAQGFKKDISWLIVFAVGTVFLLDRMYEIHLMRYFWPLSIIGAGLWILSRKSTPLRKVQEHDYRQKEETTGDTDVIDDVAVFGAIKKNIISKKFRGGEIVILFGGVDLNLTHADIQGDVVMEVTQLFGGTKIFIPAHWQVTLESVAVFGGSEDKRKRQMLAELPATDKRLIIRGISIFGGLEVRSFV